MSDLQAGRARLDQFTGFVACGGFSYGDTLGAGEGWARSILFNPRLAERSSRPSSPWRQLRARRLQRLPDAGRAGADDPGRRGLAEVRAQPQRAVRGAAVALVEVLDSPSPLLRRHGRQPDPDRGGARRGPRLTSRSAAMRPVCCARCAWVDGSGQPTEAYPANPNGSPGGLTAVTTADGRFTVFR
jgi:phosphoribosylformylglycinamidine synthase